MHLTPKSDKRSLRWNCLDEMFCTGVGISHFFVRPQVYVQGFTFVLFFFSANFVWQDHDFLKYFWHIVELAQYIKNTSRKSWSVPVSDRRVLPRRKLSSRISEDEKYPSVTRTLFQTRAGHIVKIISMLELLPKILNSRHSDPFNLKLVGA